MKTILKPSYPKLFILIAGLFVVILLLSFRLYLHANKTTPRSLGQPAEWGMATKMPDHIILNHTDDPSTSQSITWRTDTTVKHAVAQIALADAAPQFWKNSHELIAQTEMLNAFAVYGAEMVINYHSVTFSNLLPSTTYTYRVGDGTHWSEWFYFSTAANKSIPFSFIFMGDIQSDILESFGPLVRQAYKTAPQARLMLYAGDIVTSAHNEKQWHEWFTATGWLSSTIAQMPAIGNHEYRGYNKREHNANQKKQAVQWQPQFTLPQNGPDGIKETAYFFDYQGVRFITLNSNEKVQEQAYWLEDILKNNHQEWTVITFHHPIFKGAYHKDNKEIRDLWQPLFEKYGVDLVLTGHEHTYTRGQALKGSKPFGPVYIVSVSGSKMYEFEKPLWKEYNAQLQRKGENTQLYQVVNVSAQKIEFRSYTATGTLYDAFDLEKEANAKTATLKEYAGTLPPERTHQNTIAYKDKK